MKIDTEIMMPINYEGLSLDVGYRADIIVEDTEVIDLESVEHVADVHKKQLLTYLKVSDKRLGLLINFSAPLIRQGITRIINGNVI